MATTLVLTPPPLTPPVLQLSHVQSHLLLISTHCAWRDHGAGWRDFAGRIRRESGARIKVALLCLAPRTPVSLLLQSIVVSCHTRRSLTAAGVHQVHDPNPDEPDFRSVEITGKADQVHLPAWPPIS